MKNRRGSQDALEKSLIFPRALRCLGGFLLCGLAGCSSSKSKLENPLAAPVVKAWLQRVASPAPKSGGAKKLLPVRINVELLAHRHPAWQLADALQSGQLAPQAPEIGPALRPIVATGNDRIALPKPAPNAPQRPGAFISSAPHSSRSLEEEQRAALEEFLAETRVRRQSEFDARDKMARADLEEAIAAALRGKLTEINPFVPAERTQLELINLRLQLLRNLPKTSAERTQALARLHELEAQWQQELRDQEKEREAALEAAQREIPTRMRREGLEALESAAANEKAAALVPFQAARDAQNSALERDFAAKNRILSVHLPAPPKIGAGGQFLETLEAPAPSNGALPEISRTATLKNVASTPIFTRGTHSTSSQIAALRAQARHDAANWARLVALQSGWKVEKSSQAPDRTAQALKILFSS